MEHLIIITPIIYLLTAANLLLNRSLSKSIKIISNIVKAISVLTISYCILASCGIGSYCESNLDSYFTYGIAKGYCLDAGDQIHIRQYYITSENDKLKLAHRDIIEAKDFYLTDTQWIAGQDNNDTYFAIKIDENEKTINTNLYYPLLKTFFLPLAEVGITVEIVDNPKEPSLELFYYPDTPSPAIIHTDIKDINTLSEITNH